MFFDSHAHLNFATFKLDAEETANRILQAGGFFINVGSDFKTSVRAVEMAEKYDKGVYSAIGCHPIHIVGESVELILENGEEILKSVKKEEVDFSAYRKLALSSKKVVAIGEIGLDYFRVPKEIALVEAKKLQQDNLINFLALAKELNLPVILHARGEPNDPFGVYDDLYEIVKEFEIKDGVVHCFGGTLSQAENFMALGFYIGITGVVTFRKAEEIQLIAKELPLDALLIETDSPYLSPEPYRSKRNEPLYVREVAKKIAEIRGITQVVVEEETFKSALALFKISV